MADPARKQSFILKRQGGDIDPDRILNVPGVLLALAVATVGVYVLLAFAPERAARIAEISAALSPKHFLAGPEANGGVLRMLSPLIGHMFIHANPPHLLFNMLWLFAFGAPIARRMGAENALKSPGAFFSAILFLTFYFLCGVAGALVFVAFHADEFTLLVGASGGVTGLLGGLVRFAFNRTSLFGPEHTKFSPLLSRSVIVWSVLIVAMNTPLVLSLVGLLAGGVNIAWEAHLGGYFFGLLTYPFFERLAKGGK